MQLLSIFVKFFKSILFGKDESNNIQETKEIKNDEIVNIGRELEEDIEINSLQTNLQISSNLYQRRR